MITAIPGTITYAEGLNSYQIVWEVFDLHPYNYSIDLDGEFKIINNTWEGQINYLLIDLPQGVYNFTIYIYDDSLNEITHSVIVIVEDQSKPIIIVSPNDYFIAEGDINEIISWTVTDLHAFNYQLIINNVNVTLDNWQSSISIDILLDGMRHPKITSLSKIYNLLD